MMYSACIIYILLFTFLTKCATSTRKFNKNEISSLKGDIFSEFQKGTASKHREKRDGNCEGLGNAIVDPALNEIEEEKDYINMQWMQGDRVIMIAYDQPIKRTSLSTNTSVWLIDATIPTSIRIRNLDFIAQPVLTVAVNPLNKVNAVLIAADYKTLYIMDGTIRKQPFPNTFSITHTQLFEEEELRSLLFHPTKPNYLTILSGNLLYYSTDSGYQWLEGAKKVVRYQWGHNNTLFYGTSEGITNYFSLYRTDNLFQTTKLLQTEVYSFSFIKVLFISKTEPTSLNRKVWVSTDNGDHFTLARIPSAGPEQTYRVMTVTESYAMIHFGNISQSGQLYISDSKFTTYTLSLSGHLLQGFYQVKSIRGVYIATVPVPNELSKIKTLITFNAGAEWNPISHADCPASDPNCQLNLYVTDYLNINAEGIQSSENAKGLILAYGTVGQSLDLTDISNLDMHISNDGGYHWESSPTPNTQFTLGNFGNLIVAVRPDLIHGGCHPISYVGFEQGNCWGTVPPSKFAGFYYCGFTMEPGASSLRTFVWGFMNDSNKWAFYVIDFQRAFDRVCSTADFESFAPHAPTGCLLGYNETFQRVRNDSHCYIATNEAQLSVHSIQPCDCKKEYDFDCDFGYERAPGPNTTCFPIPGYAVSEHCLPGEVSYQQNELGLRLIPGDRCSNPDRFITAVEKPCTKWNYVANFVHSHRTGSIAAGVIIIFLLLLSIGLACYFVARVWLRRAKKKEPIAYMSLLNATEGEDNSASGSDVEKDRKEDDCEPLEFD